MIYALCIRLCACSISVLALSYVNGCVTKKPKTYVGERINIVNNSWITHVQSGTFYASDLTGKQIVFQWHSVQNNPEKLNSLIKSASNMLAQVYTQQELDFARKYPEAVATEMFLKPLESLFSKGPDSVDWSEAEHKLKAYFEQFFTNTDFGKFTNQAEIQLWLFAKDAITDQNLGVIQFMVAPDYAYGNVKVGMFVMSAQAQNSNINLLLLSSIFYLLPDATRLFLHTRITDKQALDLYESLGFLAFEGPLPYWADREYKTEYADILQKTAKEFSK